MAVSTRNAGRRPPSTKTTTKPISAPPRSSLPLSAPATLVALHTLTLMAGSLYSTLTPTPPYDPITQSHHPAPSYFARKDNILNVYFVKVLWFWTTLAFALLVLPLASQPRRLAQALVRYGLATGVWVLVTQWAFGPGVIDRAFAASGGLCALAARKDLEAGLTSDSAVAGIKRVEGVVTGAACRAAGGTWAGGHDISGHVFLLILGSGMLVLEALPLVRRRWTLGTRAVAVTVGLSWWMLLMTATYFHTWLEKLTGWAVALTALGVIYVLPTQVEVVRQLVGRPGE